MLIFLTFYTYLDFVASIRAYMRFFACSEHGIFEDLSDLLGDLRAAGCDVIRCVTLEIALQVTNMVRIMHTVLGEEMHQLEEVVLDFEGVDTACSVTIRVLGDVKGTANGISITTIIDDNAQSLLEDAREDNVTKKSLLLHIFLNELDQELVDLDLKLSRDELQILWFYHGDDLLQLWASDNLFLGLSIVLDHLPEDDNYEEVNTS